MLKAFSVLFAFIFIVAVGAISWLGFSGVTIEQKTVEQSIPLSE